MKTILSALVTVTCALTFCVSSFASAEYVIANHDSNFNNYLTVYELDTSSGSLKQVGLLATNGSGLGGGINVNRANIEQAITQNGSCIFALNAGSSDIAAFSAATQYSLVGNYSSSEVNASYNGGSLALTRNGKFLYASYSLTFNIGAWQVNPDCSLTFVGSYVPMGGINVGPIKVSPNGQALVVPSYSTLEEPGLAEMFRIESSGSLADVGYLPNTCKSPVECGLYGLDFTKDSKLVAFSTFGDGDESAYPFALIAHVTPNGLVKPRSWPLQNPAGISIPMVSPFFSSAGYQGSGDLYFGASNGVITTSFTESPLALHVTNAVAAGGVDGNIAVTGNIMVMAADSDQIFVFSINADGSLTTLSTTTVKGQHLDVFSITLFPNTR